MMFSIDHMIVTCVTTVIFVKAMWEKKALKRVFINTFFWREESSKDEGSPLMETHQVEAPPWQLVGILCVHV